MITSCPPRHHIIILLVVFSIVSMRHNRDKHFFNLVPFEVFMFINDLTLSRTDVLAVPCEDVRHPSETAKEACGEKNR